MPAKARHVSPITNQQFHLKLPPKLVSRVLNSCGGGELLECKQPLARRHVRSSLMFEVCAWCESLSTDNATAFFDFGIALELAFKAMNIYEAKFSTEY